MIKKNKLKEELENDDSYDPYYKDESIRGNEKELTRQYENRRDKVNEEYYVNKNEKKATRIENEYNDKIINPLSEDLIKQKKEYNRKKGARFSNLKKLLRGE